MVCCESTGVLWRSQPENPKLIYCPQEKWLIPIISNQSGFDSVLFVRVQIGWQESYSFRSYHNIKRRWIEALIFLRFCRNFKVKSKKCSLKRKMLKFSALSKKVFCLNAQQALFACKTIPGWLVINWKKEIRYKISILGSDF